MHRTCPQTTIRSRNQNTCPQTTIRSRNQNVWRPQNIKIVCRAVKEASWYQEIFQVRAGVATAIATQDDVATPSRPPARASHMSPGNNSTPQSEYLETTKYPDSDQPCTRKYFKSGTGCATTTVAPGQHGHALHAPCACITHDSGKKSKDIVRIYRGRKISR